MTRGNQREKAREKNLKKLQEQAKKKGTAEKGTNKGASLLERQMRDAEKMREKQAAAVAKKQGEASGGK